MKKKAGVLLTIFFITIFSYVYCDEKTFLKNQQYIFSDEYYDRDGGTEGTKKMLDKDFPLIEIIGWSRDGMIAYRYITTESEASSWEYRFLIVDTVTDNIIENDCFTMIDWYEEIKKELSEAYKAKWNILLRKHDIIGIINDPFKEINKNDFNKFPINNFECWFEYSIEKNKDDFANLIHWKLIIGNNNVQKTINHATERGYYDIHGRKILGFYKSPYENRIAVFVSSYDSFVHPFWGVRLYGCNMNIWLTP
jgi:hypothetical protein